MYQYMKKINKLDGNKYFLNLNNISLESFYNSQKDFIHAVDNWSKVLCHLIMKLPSFKERALILENLYDEHGNGDLKKCHVNTFNDFLKEINPNHIAGNSSYAGNYVGRFNKELMETLENESWVYCTAMIGMIEYTYITASSHITKYVSNYKRVENHYSEHETLDYKHYKDLFSLIEDLYDTNKEEIEKGIYHGYKLLNHLYVKMSFLCYDNFRVKH